MMMALVVLVAFSGTGSHGGWGGTDGAWWWCQTITIYTIYIYV